MSNLQILGHEVKREKEGKHILQTVFATLHIFFISVSSECVPLPTSILSEEVKRKAKEFRNMDNIPE